MSMNGLRLAPVIALFLACVPAPTLAQSLDQDYHYKLSTASRSVGLLGGDNKLFVERVTERVNPKPWGVQLSAGFSRERVLAAYETIATHYAALLADKDTTTIVSSFFRSRGTETFYQVRVGADAFESANNLCAELRRAGGACMVLRNKLNQDSDPNRGSVSAKAVDNVTQF